MRRSASDNCLETLASGDFAILTFGFEIYHRIISFPVIEKEYRIDYCIEGLERLFSVEVPLITSIHIPVVGTESHDHA